LPNDRRQEGKKINLRVKGREGGDSGEGTSCEKTGSRAERGIIAEKKLKQNKTSPQQATCVVTDTKEREGKGGCAGEHRSKEKTKGARAQRNRRVPGREMPTCRGETEAGSGKRNRFLLTTGGEIEEGERKGRRKPSPISRKKEGRGRGAEETRNAGGVRYPLSQNERSPLGKASDRGSCKG